MVSAAMVGGKVGADNAILVKLGRVALLFPVALVMGYLFKKEAFLMGKLKVLFHLNEPERWQRTLLNVINFVKDVGQENADIEVVANGAAVSAYIDKCQIAGGSGETPTSCGKANGELYEEMNKLAQMGIKFVACRNALRMHSLDENMLPPFVTVVPAGITEIAKKQAEGYAYIKA